MSPLMLPMAKDSQKDLPATSICRVGEAPPSTYTETTSLLFTATMVWYLDGTALIVADDVSESALSEPELDINAAQISSFDAPSAKMSQSSQLLPMENTTFVVPPLARNLPRRAIVQSPDVRISFPSSSSPPYQ